MHRIFISYKRLDADVVFKIMDDIEREFGNGICWIDTEGIESHERYVSKICKAIDECEIFLFMHSWHHTQITDFENDWTIKELEYAKDEEKIIAIIKIDEFNLVRDFKFEFNKQQQTEYNNPEMRERLFRDLRKWLSSPRKQAAKPYSRPESGQIQSVKPDLSGHETKPKNNTKFIIAGIAAALIIAAGLFLMRGNQETIPTETVITIPETQAIEPDVNAQDYEEPVAVPAGATETPKPKELSSQELYKLGEERYRSNDFAGAVSYFLKAAEMGDMKAQAALGNCYLSGKGVIENEAKAMEWYTKAAEQGDVESQYTLGLSHALNDNYETAIEWFSKAADQGHEKAMRYLQELKGIED